MKNIKLIIAYEGTKYCGWQTQKNGIGIQEVISDAIQKLTNEKVCLNASGRTDAGVHAMGQVANFTSNATIPPERFALALNSFLPEDISVISSEEVANDFHARYSARGKTYRYYIWNCSRKSAIVANITCYIPQMLDVSKMVEAAELFIGEHDFASYMAQGSSVKTTVREIFDATVTEVQNPFDLSDGKMICFEITGSGFLYNMVRIISGTLVEVGQGKRSKEQIVHSLEKGERTLAGQTLPPEGLFLCKVNYEKRGIENV